MARILKNYINGQWVPSQATETLDVINPATEEVIAQVPLSPAEDTNQAIQAAQTAFQSWKKVAVPKRGRYFFKLQNLLMEHKQELARLVTMENGKALSESLGEVQRGIENVENAASITNLMMGDSISTGATDIEITNYRYPIGVIGGITPFNFPMMVPFWIFPIALATGNTVVLKPSEKAPMLM
ncbi:MAG: aldehyde dehydrogenase family protein, partial [Bombilactobacillus sp.]